MSLALTIPSAVALIVIPLPLVSVLFQRGAAYFEQDQLQQAVENWSAVLEIDPEHADARYNRGLASRQLGDAMQAVADLTAYLSLVPDSAEAFNQRGLAYLELEQVEQAIADVTRSEIPQVQKMLEN